MKKQAQVQKLESAYVTCPKDKQGRVEFQSVKDHDKFCSTCNPELHDALYVDGCGCDGCQEKRTIRMEIPVD